MPQLPVRASQPYIDAVQKLASKAGYESTSAMIEALLDVEAKRVGVELPQRANPRGVRYNKTNKSKP